MDLPMGNDTWILRYSQIVAVTYRNLMSTWVDHVMIRRVSSQSMHHLNLNSFVLLLLPFFRHKTYRFPCSISLAWLDGQLHLKVHSSSTDINGMKLVRSFANKPVMPCFKRNDSSRHFYCGHVEFKKTRPSPRVLKWWKSDKLMMTFATAKCFAFCKHTACHLSYHPMNGAEIPKN